jgi:general secretion pathway protein K
MTARRGFALLAVLWVLVGVTALGLLLMRTARDEVGAIRNRVARTRAAWLAEGCAERVRAVVDDAMTEMRRVDSAWQALDSMVAASPMRIGCDVTLVPAGLTLDVNAIDGNTLRRLLIAAGTSDAVADSVADALIDWRDVDDDALPFGAERAWYANASRHPPRNGPLTSPVELALVRGTEEVPNIQSLLGVRSERVLLTHAPPAVLAALPGMTAEAVARIRQLRSGGHRVNLQELGAVLSMDARRQLLSGYQELTRLVTSTPDAWIITATASSGVPAVADTITLRLVRSGQRAAVIERRVAP